MINIDENLLELGKKCEEEIKQIKGCKSRCIVNEKAIDEKCVCCGKDAKYHVIWGIQY